MATGLLCRADIFNGPTPGIDTDILGSPIKLKYSDSALRLTVVLGGDSTFKMTEKRGAVTQTYIFRAGNDQLADAMYTYTFGATKKHTDGTDIEYNFQTGANVQVKKLLISEVLGGEL